MVHLHMRSSYSLLESPIRLENMILHQKQLGFNHVCLTDHNVMYGTMEFYQLCKKHNVHPIIGLEVDSIYNEEPFHFILLAKNDMGLQNLYKLSSIIKGNVSFEEVIKYACMENIGFQIRQAYLKYYTERVFRNIDENSDKLYNIISENL